MTFSSVNVFWFIREFTFYMLLSTYNVTLSQFHNFFLVDNGIQNNWLQSSQREIYKAKVNFSTALALQAGEVPSSFSSSPSVWAAADQCPSVLTLQCCSITTKLRPGSGSNAPMHQDISDKCEAFLPLAYLYGVTRWLQSSESYKRRERHDYPHVCLLLELTLSLCLEWHSNI